MLCVCIRFFFRSLLFFRDECFSVFYWVWERFWVLGLILFVISWVIVGKVFSFFELKLNLYVLVFRLRGGKDTKILDFICSFWFFWILVDDFG